MSCLISKRSGLDSLFALPPFRSSTCNIGVELLPDAARAKARLSSAIRSSSDWTYRWGLKDQPRPHGDQLTRRSTYERSAPVR